MVTWLLDVTDKGGAETHLFHDMKRITVVYFVKCFSLIEGQS
jgi:hypothetical protein